MNIILFKNTIESQEFFSFELSKAFEELGHRIFFYDCLNEAESYFELRDFIKAKKDIAAFTFNFHGMINDDFLLDGRDPVFWNETGIPLINMMVDHPYYYHEQLKHIPKNYIQIGIDRNHIRYMKRFFPEVDSDHFVELGGTCLSASFPCDHIPNIPISNRPFDLVFTGHYVDPEGYGKYLKHLDDSVKAFYMEIYSVLKENPHRTLEDTAEDMIRSEFGDRVNDDYLKQCFPNMVFIDLMIRHYFRGQAVKALTDGGIKVHIFGTGFEQLSLKHPENLIIHGRVDSRKCLDVISNARISLNVMPWFKDGSHDRIFNTMLNGALSLSDPSVCMKEHFTDWKDIVFFSLLEMDSLPDKAQDLLSNPEKLRAIAENGQKNARAHHTWRSRAIEILDIIEHSLSKRAYNQSAYNR